MNTKEIQKFVMRYLESTECHIIEKSPSHVTVRLSPEADKDLTNRPYYWGFVERTGAAPETMTMTFVFEPGARPPALQTPAQAQAARQAPPPQPAPASPPAGASGDSILGRYFGFAPAPPAVGRVPFDEVTYGSRRLEQLFGVVRSKGRYVQMYEDIKTARGAPPAACTTWLAVNYKVEFCCDMKRDELHSLGISLMTGEIREEFHDALTALPLTPRLPPNTLVQRPVWSIPRAIAALESYLAREIQNYNHDWSFEAKERLTDELERVDAYYQELLPSLADPEQQAAAQAQYEARRREIEWQYAPRIHASVVSAGIFHLGIDTPLPR